MSTVRFLATVPQAVRASFLAEDDFTAAMFSVPGVRAAVERLLTDLRARDAWQTVTALEPVEGPQALTHAERLLIVAAFWYEQGLKPTPPWAQKPEGERQSWMRRMRKISAEFLDVMEEGPPTQHVSLEAIEEFARSAGVSIAKVRWDDDLDEPVVTAGVRSSELHDLWSKHIGDLPTLVRRYIAASEADASHSPQLLKKPRNAHWARDRFLTEMTYEANRLYGKPLQSVVAAFGEVMFDDAAINVRLVRRLTTGK